MMFRLLAGGAVLAILGLVGGVASLQKCAARASHPAIQALYDFDTANERLDRNALADLLYVSSETEEYFKDPEELSWWQTNYPAPGGKSGRELYRYWMACDWLEGEKMFRVLNKDHKIDADAASYRLLSASDAKATIQAEDDINVYEVTMKYQDGAWRYWDERIVRTK